MAQIISSLLNMLFSILEGVFNFFFEFINIAFSSERKQEYDADFLPSGEILSSFNHGFCLTGKKSLTIQDSFKNALVIGGTGSNKTSGILIPSILKMKGHCSMVINDPSGELLHKTSGALLKDGYEVLVLNYGSQNSEGYNPINNKLTVPEILKIAKMLVTIAMGVSNKDPFWNMAAENLIGLCIRYILRHTDKQFHNLYNVYHVISTMAYAPKQIDSLFVSANDPELLSEYKAFLSYGDKTLASIIATCRTALSIFGTDPMVALNTSFDTFDFSKFRNKKVALYINTSVKDMRYYSIVTSLFLDQFFGEILSRVPSEKELPVFFFIDEASSLYFNNLQLVCSNIRKTKASIIQIYQSASQLQDLYGSAIARAITENCFAKVYMSGQPISVTQELSTTLGNFEYKNEHGTRVIRPLATPSEIREMEECLILCGNHRAIKTKIVPYFKQYTLLQLSKLKPFEPTCKHPFDKPPLLLHP